MLVWLSVQAQVLQKKVRAILLEMVWRQAIGGVVEKSMTSHGNIEIRENVMHEWRRTLICVITVELEVVFFVGHWSMQSFYHSEQSDAVNLSRWEHRGHRQWRSPANSG